MRRPFLPLLSLTIALILMLVVLSVIAPLAAAEFYDADELTLNLSLASTLTIKASGPDPVVDYATANLQWFPRETYREHLIVLQTTPAATQLADGYEFRWDRPGLGPLPFSLNAIITTTDRPLGVTDIVPFPIASVPAQIARYTQPTTLIDTNAAIEEQALALAQDKTDLFSVVHAVASWVTDNVQYNLTTLTADATQKSTWVMQNRYGVCDEMTGLFISMLRSLGIPARFVSGLAYTNLPEFSEPWGGHGWAEVYFPGTGWVPFDVTYGTYGYVDSTHLKLAESADSATDSAEYVSRGRDVVLQTRKLDMHVDVLSQRSSGLRPFSVTLTPFEQTIGLRSANMLTARVQNRMPYYLSVRLQLANTQDIEIVGPHERTLLLPPNGDVTTRFVVRTQALRPRFIYTFPVKLYVGQQALASSQFQAKEGAASYDEAFFARFADASAELSAGEQLPLACTADGARYLGESVALRCVVTNNQSSSLRVELCLENCSSAVVSSGGTLERAETRACSSAGLVSVLAQVSRTNKRQQAIVRYECLDQAALAFQNVTAPPSLAFDEEGSVAFTLERRSDSIPQDLIVKTTHDNFHELWNVSDLSDPRRFTLNIRGSNLLLGENTLVFSVDYHDKLGKAYHEEQQVQIATRDFTWWQQLYAYSLKAERWLRGLFGQA